MYIYCLRSSGQYTQLDIGLRGYLYHCHIIPGFVLHHSASFLFHLNDRKSSLCNGNCSPLHLGLSLLHLHLVTVAIPCETMSTISTEHSAASHSVQTSAVQPPEFCNACIKQVEVEEREEGLEEEECHKSGDCNATLLGGRLRLLCRHLDFGNVLLPPWPLSHFEDAILCWYLGVSCIFPFLIDSVCNRRLDSRLEWVSDPDSV